MSAREIILIVMLLVFLIGVPIVLVWSLVDHFRGKGSERTGGGGVSSFVGGAMMEIDRVIRPSVEHTIETEDRVVKDEDDIGGQ